VSTVDDLDRKYLALVAEKAETLPEILHDPLARARKASIDGLVHLAATALVHAITDHDLAVYGELLPEETP
jgi:hypothetical protein